MTLPNVALSDPDCKFDDLFYDIKLLDVSSQRGFAIDSRTKSVMQFGDCKNHAVLELDDEELIVFDLDEDVGVPIRLIGREESALDSLRGSLNSVNFWNTLLETSSNKLPLDSNVEIKAFLFNGGPVIFFYQPTENLIDLFLDGDRKRIQNFVTDRVNELRYLEAMMSLLEEVDGAGSLSVAGDQGFVLSSSGRDNFVSYPAIIRYSICPFSEILERIRKLPLGVIANNVSADDAEYRRILINLTNYAHRSKYTSISFGCEG